MASKQPQAESSPNRTPDEIANGGEPRHKRLGAPECLAHSVADYFDYHFPDGLKEDFAKDLP